MAAMPSTEKLRSRTRPDDRAAGDWIGVFVFSDGAGFSRPRHDHFTERVLTEIFSGFSLVSPKCQLGRHEPVTVIFFRAYNPNKGVPQIAVLLTA